jgi:hypothetical protein
MSELESILPPGLSKEEIVSVEKEYKRMRKIELLLQQYLFHCEYEENEEIREKIKATIEGRLEKLGATNEDKLLALYRLDMPTKNYNSTKKMIQQYEKLVNVPKVKDRLHKILLYDQYQNSLTEKKLEEIRKKRSSTFLSEQT